MDAISLTHGQHIDVTVGGQTIRLAVDTDDSGTSVSLRGVDCDLTGEEPGLYYLEPLGTIAAQFAPPK